MVAISSLPCFPLWHRSILRALEIHFNFGACNFLLFRCYFVHYTGGNNRTGAQVTQWHMLRAHNVRVAPGVITFLLCHFFLITRRPFGYTVKLQWNKLESNKIGSVMNYVQLSRYPPQASQLAWCYNELIVNFRHCVILRICSISKHSSNIFTVIMVYSYGSVFSVFTDKWQAIKYFGNR